MKLKLAVSILVAMVTSLNAQQEIYHYDESFIRPNFEQIDSNQVENQFYQQNNSSISGNWSKEFTVPGIIGAIYTSTTDGTNLYLGGLFRTAGNTIANSVVKWDGRTWSSIGEGAENGVNRRYASDVPSVEAMTYYDGKLFVGGQFPKAGTKEANGVAYWDGNSWQTLGRGITNGVRRYIIVENDTTFVPGFVYSLFAHKNKIYVGGFFHLAGGRQANGLAAWDINTGDWETFHGGLASHLEHDPVYAYAFGAKADDIYVGGKFSYAGGIPAQNIAKWDGENWSAIGSAEGYIAINGLKFDTFGNLYAAGYYNPDPATGAIGIGKWDGANWTSVHGPEGYNSSAFRIQMYNNELYVSGYFENAQTLPAHTLAKWDGTSWQFIGGLGIAANEYLPGGARTIDFVNGKMYLAGDFTRAGDVFTVNVVEWDYNNSQWKKLDNSHANKGVYDGYINVLERSGNLVYAGGSFSVVGDVYARNIAQWNGTEWQSVGTGYENGVRGSIYTILADGNDVYVGGHFGSAGSVEAYHIAKWDGSKWSSIGIGVGGVSGAHVNALAKVGDYLYAGGRFAIVGDEETYALPASSIARFNLTTQRWESLGSGIEYTSGLPGIVTDLEVHGNKIYVAGQFNSAGDISYLNFAVLTDNKWSGLGDIENIGIEGGTNVVKVINNEIYIGGYLQLERFGEYYGILKWDGKEWIEIGDRLMSDSDNVFVLSIEPYQDGLIAGGLFKNIGNLEVNNLAYFDGSEWSEIGGGVQPGVSNIALFNNKILISGPSEIFAGGGIGIGLVQYDLNVTSVEDENQTINEFALFQNYPNPFNPETRISYYLPKSAEVELSLYNMLGQKLRTLLREFQTSGRHEVRLHASDLSSGVYVYELKSGDLIQRKKLLLVK